MRDPGSTPTTLAEVAAELRRMRAESARREEEIWEAVDEMRTLLARGNGNGPGGGGDKGEGIGNGVAGGSPEARAKAGTDTGVPTDRDHRASAYRSLKRRLRSFVTRTLPEGARVAVVSRGDDALLDLPGCHGEHFPRQPGGAYTGFYPNDGLAAIAHFQWVRAEGADYLLFPDTALWWLERFPLLTAHIRSRCPEVASESGVGTIYKMRGVGRDSALWPEVVRELLEEWGGQKGALPSILDWGTGRDLAKLLPGRTVFTPPDDRIDLPYLDATVDIVAVSDDVPGTLAEAHRVARHSVVRFSDLRSAVDGGVGRPTLHAVEHRNGGPDPLPSATIVVPTYNGLRHLVPCLRALDDTLPVDFNGEVLVVDDASGPETASGLRRLSKEHGWLRVVRNEKNSGFITSCNRGADEATGDFLVFLNDDTVPLAGWLGALLRTFRTHPDAGAVGGRLVYPDGRLQEAGGVIFRDGSGANFGRGDYEVDAPLYAHVRPVHYCSGALLATPRSLFLELGGFDVVYRPAYYEDTDYCFSVRDSGRRVYYQPEATVVHVEGATSGTDVRRGVKRYQARNRATFRTKWETQLAELAPPPTSYSAHTWHRLAFDGGAA